MSTTKDRDGFWKAQMRRDWITDETHSRARIDELCTTILLLMDEHPEPGARLSRTNPVWQSFAEARNKAGQGDPDVLRIAGVKFAEWWEQRCKEAS